MARDSLRPRFLARAAQNLNIDNRLAEPTCNDSSRAHHWAVVLHCFARTRFITSIQIGAGAL